MERSCRIDYDGHKYVSQQEQRSDEDMSNHSSDSNQMEGVVFTTTIAVPSAPALQPLQQNNNQNCLNQLTAEEMLWKKRQLAECRMIEEQRQFEFRGGSRSHCF